MPQDPQVFPHPTAEGLWPEKIHAFSPEWCGHLLAQKSLEFRKHAKDLHFIRRDSHHLQDIFQRAGSHKPADSGFVYLRNPRHQSTLC